MTTADVRLDLEAPRPPPRPRRRWEYHVCEVDHPMGVGSLDGLGRRGWRLCGIVRHGGLITYTFTRPSGRIGP